MKTFQTVAWEKSSEADNICNELFKKPADKKSKKKTLKKSISKKKAKLNSNEKLKNKKDVIKKNIKNILEISTQKSPKKKKNKEKHVEVNTFIIEENENNSNAQVAKKKKKQKRDKCQKKFDFNSSHTVAHKQSENPENLVKNTTKDGKIKKKRKRKNKLTSHNMDELLPSYSNEARPSQNKGSFASKKEKLKEKLQHLLSLNSKSFSPNPAAIPFKSKTQSLRDKMRLKLKAARFRYINEQIYSTDSKEAQKFFENDPDAFTAYHEGYQQQVHTWPLNPLDVIIKSIKKLPKSHIIADFGCGEAQLAKSVKQKVHSFDLVALNDSVLACDMANVPLENNSIDVAIFCLSLMGTNLHDYLMEANRVLKVGGLLKIAEIESRFDNLTTFFEGLRHFHFKNIHKDLSHNLFYFLDFKKEANIKNKKKLPTLSLNPCLYKKR